MKNKTLVVLAAGIGSKFGGLKQVEKFGPNGEYIIDYSIYDAIRCGFNKVVFVIKEENYELFKETIGKRISNHVSVEYAFQNYDNIPSKYKIPKERVKPFGTGHAVLCAKSKVDSPFAVIGADDFYGYEAFRDISNFMDNNSDKIGVVGYKLINTLTDHGFVKRGVLFADKENNFENIIECVVEKKKDYIEAKPFGSDEDKADEMKLDNNALTSMIMSCAPASFMDLIESEFIDFLDTADLMEDEYFYPSRISSAKDKKLFDVKVVLTNAKHTGVTYKEDADKVRKYIRDLIDKKIYKEDLWG